MRREQVEIEAPSIGGAGTVIGYGHWGRPVLLFPAEQGRAWDLEDNGMVDAVAGPDRGRPREALLRRLLRRRVVVEPAIPLEERARAHDAYEAWIVERVVPAIHDDLGGRAGDPHRRRAAWAPTTRPTSRSSAPTSSRWRCACPATTTPRTWHGWGERGDAAYFNNPMDYVEHLGGDHLDWLRSRVSLLLVCGQGQWEDTTGALDSTRAVRRAARTQGDSSRARPVGARRAARLAVVARPARPSSAAVLLMPDTTHHIGLLLGTEDDWPTAFETLVRRLGADQGDGRPSTPHRRRAADHRAVRPARQAAPRAGHRPPRVLVLPPARVAEEGRADGRRLPAQQPVHVPVDGEARGLLRDDAAAG